MAEYDGLKPGQILADASVAEFIKNLGLGIAEAQKALDDNSVQQIAEFIEPIEGLGGKTLLDLGLSPAFYHYQYADLKCSMQLSLKVQKNLSLGLNIGGSYKSTSSGSNNESASESYSEKGNKVTQSRQASLDITTASEGSLTINQKSYQLTGTTSDKRLDMLQDSLVSDKKSGIDRVLYKLKKSLLSIVASDSSRNTFTTPNTVAFTGGEHDSGVIRIGENVDTVFGLDDSPAVSVNTTARGSLGSYAAYVAAEIAGDHSVDHIKPDGLFKTITFDTDKFAIPEPMQEYLESLAKAMLSLNFKVTIEGYADTQGYSGQSKEASEVLNKQLADNRAIEVLEALMANGVPAANITVNESRGTQAARDAGDPPGKDNRAFRKVEIRNPDHTGHWLLVRSKGNGKNLSNVSPLMVGDTSSSNGFISLSNAEPQDLSGVSVSIEGVSFPYRGSATPGFVENSSQAYAENLAQDINAASSSGLKAYAHRNIVTVCRSSDKYSMVLVTSSNRNIKLEGSEGITITSQFTHSKTTSLTRKSTGNRSVAVGATLDARYSRQFEMNVTGNSSIAARLVSIPAPPQFLETIKEFLDNEE